eukprot:TRINITY_DN777996_c0_g1_i1.p1 TRINITY_DN777996_c0_g1~~TRINITY_DN777996_c0_g1_i1.p1  ORF type:complete len:226 (+),score=53.86 TRINITY_DN777996_c0_g1_i1:48-725(+)
MGGGASTANIKAKAAKKGKSSAKQTKEESILKFEVTDNENNNIRVNLCEEHLSIDQLTNSEWKETMMFAYGAILCWGSSDSTFQFRIIGSDTSLNTYVYNTKVGQVIEDALFSKVTSLMQMMEAQCLSKEQMSLVESIFELGTDDCLEVLKTCTAQRQITIHQSVQLVHTIKKTTPDMNPFDLIDIVCVLYERLVHKETYSLLLEELDEDLRENTALRMGVSYDK